MEKKETYRMVLIVIVLFNLQLLFCSSLSANPAKDSVTVYIEEWPPFRITAPNTPTGFRGLDIDLLTKIEEKMGVRFTIIRQPWARCLISMETGQGDLISGAAFSEERASYIHYIQPSYFSIGPVFYVRKGAAKTIQRYEDLKPLLIGYSIKSVYFEPFDSDSTLRKYGVSREGQLLKMLSAGRLDAIIGTDINIYFDAKSQGLQNLIEPSEFKPKNRTPLYIGISKRSPFLKRAPEISAVLQNLIDIGFVDELKNRYMP